MNKLVFLSVLIFTSSNVLGMLGQTFEIWDDTTSKTNIKMYNLKQRKILKMTEPSLEKNRRLDLQISPNKSPIHVVKTYDDTNITNIKQKDPVNNENLSYIEKAPSLDIAERYPEKDSLKRINPVSQNKIRNSSSYHITFSGEEYSRYNAREAELETKRKKQLIYELEETKRLLGEGKHPDQIKKNNETLMVNAVKYSNLKLAKLLLKHGANPNQLGTLFAPSSRTSNKSFVSLLSIAFLNNNLDMMKLLLKQGINPDNSSLFFCSLFFIAYSINRLDLAELLLKYGADPNQKGWMGNYSFLIDAVQEQNINMVKLLLKYGANPNQTDIFEETPTLIAAEKKNVDLVKLLIEHGGRFYVSNKNSIFSNVPTLKR